MRDLAVVGHKVVGGVFGRHAALQGVSASMHGRLRAQADLGIIQRRSLGDQKLALHDVDSGDFLGHRVLDLNTRIDLDEIELVRVAVDQKFDSTGIFVLHGLADPQRRVAHVVAQVRIEIGRRGDLGDLLMPALQ